MFLESFNSSPHCLKEQEGELFRVQHDNDYMGFYKTDAQECETRVPIRRMLISGGGWGEDGDEDADEDADDDGMKILLIHNILLLLFLDGCNHDVEFARRGCDSAVGAGGEPRLVWRARSRMCSPLGKRRLLLIQFTHHHNCVMYIGHTGLRMCSNP